jgi:predicted Zn finger-like uncharacterized protein
MRIVCPSCKSTYDVPDAALAGSPRLVRCARCGTEWAPEPAAAQAIHPSSIPASSAAEPPTAAPPTAAPPAAEWPASQSLAVDAPEADPPPGRAEPKLAAYRRRRPPAQPDAAGAAPYDDAPPPKSRVALLGWALSVILLAAIAWAAVSYRAQVMAAWPPSERVYGALGLR